MGSNLIFITGAGSSGTTAVQMALLAHPDCSSCFEVSIGMDYVMGKENAKYRPHWVTRPERYGLTKPAILSTRAALPNVVESFYRLADYHRAMQGGRVFVCKAPHNIEYIGVLHDLWPAAPVVVTVRHPLTWIPSIMVRNIGPVIQSRPNARDSIEAACETWNYAAEILLRTEDVICVPAEHVVQELPGVFHYCGLDWNEDYLHWRKHVQPKLRPYDIAGLSYKLSVIRGDTIQNMTYSRLANLTPEQREYIVANTDWEMLYPAAFTEGLMRHARNMDSR